MLPSVLKGTRVLLSGKTDAESRVDRRLPSIEEVKRGAIRLRKDGGTRVSRDKRIGTSRVVVESWHASEEKADRLSRQARSVLIPDAVNGFYGLVGDVKFEGVEEDGEASYLPDPDTGEERYIQSFLINYTNPY